MKRSKKQNTTGETWIYILISRNASVNSDLLWQIFQAVTFCYFLQIAFFLFLLTIIAKDVLIFLTSPHDDETVSCVQTFDIPWKNSCGHWNLSPLPIILSWFHHFISLCVIMKSYRFFIHQGCCFKKKCMYTYLSMWDSLNDGNIIVKKGNLKSDISYYI